jgi:hypothetical protein
MQLSLTVNAKTRAAVRYGDRSALLDSLGEFGRRNLLDCLRKIRWVVLMLVALLLVEKLLRELETDSQLVKGIMELELMAFAYSGRSSNFSPKPWHVHVRPNGGSHSPFQQEERNMSSSQQQEAAALSRQFDPQLHKLSAGDREEAEVAFEELEKRLQTIDFDLEKSNKVRADLMELEDKLQDPRVIRWLCCLEIGAQLLTLTSHNLHDQMWTERIPVIDSDVPPLREAGLGNLGLSHEDNV